MSTGESWDWRTRVTRGFRRFALAEGTSPSVVFKAGESRCGIYILEFSNGERYVGQSRDAARRLADHRRRFADIEAFQFVSVGLMQLDDAERQVIQAQKDAGFRLRNVLLTSESWTGSVLDRVVDPEVQRGWAAGGEQEHPDDLRMLIAGRRRSTRRKYEELQRLESFSAVFADLCTYIGRCIPWPSATDGQFWVVTAMPSTGKNRQAQRLTAVSCGNVEVFVIIEDRESHEAWWFLNLESGVVSPSSLPVELREALEATDGYRTAGRVDRLFGVIAGSLEELFDETPDLEIAARRLALALMRKGRSLFAKHHCDDMVDDILLELHARA